MCTCVKRREECVFFSFLSPQTFLLKTEHEMFMQFVQNNSCAILTSN